MIKIYYADGTVDVDLWDNKNDVVAVVVYGDQYTTETAQGTITGTYKTLHYQDEDEPGQYYFWIQGTVIHSGFNPVGTQVKAAAPLGDYDTIMSQL